MSSLIAGLAHDDYFTVICGTLTIIGFIMTLWVTVRTNSIHKRIFANQKIEQYNKKRKALYNDLKGYRDALDDANSDLRKIKTNIDDDINMIKNEYKNVLNFRQRIRIRQIVREIRKDKPVTKRVIILLTDLMATFWTEKEQKNV